MPSLPESPATTINSEKTLEPQMSLSKNGKNLGLGSKKLSSKRKLSDRRYELKRTRGPLHRLGVTVAEYVAAPKISPILREITGGKRMALKAMRFSSAECIHKFLDMYDSISLRDREKLSLEAIALAAKVDIALLLGEILLAIREHNVNVVKFIAVGSHPEVMKKTVESALVTGGWRDREHIHTMLGALPSPKGPTFIGKFFAGGTQDPEEPKEPSDDLMEDVDYIFPDSSVMQDRIQPMRQKLLPGK